MDSRIDLLGVLQKDYSTAEPTSRPLFPGVRFYYLMVEQVIAASRKAKRGIFTHEDYYRHGLAVLRAVERVGGRIEISGVSKVPQFPGPYVYVANHMSVLETIILSSMLYPIGEHTFIVKQSLIDYPVFKHIMRAMDPIVVGRVNPREDLEVVLREGVKKLQDGISVVVFPQHTRTTEFIPEKFNTLGIKLAKRGGATVVPIALKTDFWGQGKLIKDFGKIYPQKTVRFRFGAPTSISGDGRQEHAAIVRFIGETLAEWETLDQSANKARSRLSS